MMTRVPMGWLCFSIGAFSSPMAPPSGATPWLRAGGEEVRASDGMVAQVSVLELWPIERPKLSPYILVFGENEPFTQ